MRCFILCGAILAAAVGPAAAADPIGEWLVADGSARIGIDNCDGKLWGIVTWEKQPGIDSKNPDRNKRNRPTLHLPILLAMVPGEDERWDGKVYNAENGKTYTAHLSMPSPDELRIEGCLLGGYLCGGETWQRYTAPDNTADAPAPPAPTPKTKTAKTPNAGPAGSRTPRQLAPAAVPAAPPLSEVCSAVSDSSGPPHEGRLK